MPKSESESESEPPGPPGYTIAGVSKLTGVGCHALRVWERRYGYPVPHRSPSGHRRYDAEQVRVLKGLAQLLHQGRPIGDLMADLRAGRLDLPDEPAAEVVPPSTRLVDHLLTGDLAAAEAHYGGSTAGRDDRQVLAALLEPALVDTGERWFRGECDVFQERCASGFVRGKLNGLLDRARVANTEPAGTVLVGTVQGDRHEGGVLIVCTLLELAGWRSIYLGVDLPVGEFRKAVAAWRPAALALSFVLSRNINKRFQELAALREVPVFVGGRSILNYQALARRSGLVPVPGPASSAVAQMLERLAAARPGS